MIVIVEGIDRVGKSTLVDRIQKATGFTVYHNNTDFQLEKMDNDNETDKMLKMLQMYNIGKPGVIFDRFHWTDFVYGCLQRDYSFTKALQNKDKIETELRVQKAVIVLVKPTDIEESSLQHGRDLSRHEQLFELLFNESKLKKLSCTYNTIYDAQKWVHNEMNDYLNGGKW